MKDIGILYEAIRKEYLFLSQDYCEYVAKDFFLERDNFSFSESDDSINVTCGSLVELIVYAVPLKFETTLSEDQKSNSNLALFQLFSDTVWEKIYPKSFFKPTIELEEEIKNNVWESLLNKIKKDKYLKIFGIDKGKLSLKQSVFHEFIRGQMIVYSLKTINQEESHIKFNEYQKYFANLINDIVKGSIRGNIIKADFEDMVSNRVLEFLVRINKPDFKLTSAIDTYFFGFMKNALKNHYSSKNFSFESIEKVNEENEKSLFLEEEMFYLEIIDKHDLYTQVAITECRKEEKRNQDILVMKQMGVPHKVIGKVVKEDASNVGTIINRFNTRVRNKVKNRPE